MPTKAAEPTYNSSILFCMHLIRETLKNVQIFILVAYFCHKLQFTSVCIALTVKTFKLWCGILLTKEIHQQRIIIEMFLLKYNWCTVFYNIDSTILYINHKQNYHWNLCTRENDEHGLETCKKTKACQNLPLCYFFTLMYIRTRITSIFIGLNFNYEKETRPETAV